MLKGLGSILILVACVGLGYAHSIELKVHLKDLEDVHKLFLLLKSELQYTKAPFSELFLNVSKKMQTPYREWLDNLSEQLKSKNRASFWETWCESIDEDLKGSRLKKAELTELKEVGKNLEHVEHLELFIEQMNERIKCTREEYRSKTKLCQSMGIMGGIFLVILLL
mgnify:CR=1 FL=1